MKRYASGGLIVFAAVWAVYLGPGLMMNPGGRWIVAAIGYVMVLGASLSWAAELGR